MTARVAQDCQVLCDSQHGVISPSCLCQVCLLLVIFPWLLPLLLVLCHDPQPRQPLWLEPEVSHETLLDGVECLAELPIRLQTQVVSPSSVSMPTTSTRPSTSPTATGISRTRTTPQSPPLRILIDLDIPELQAAASTQQQQAWFPPCRNLVHWEIASRKFWRIMTLLTVIIASGKLVQTQIEKPLFSTLFRSESTGKRDQDQNVVQSLKDRKISIKSLR